MPRLPRGFRLGAALVIALCSALAAHDAPAAEPRRLALVYGNARYQHAPVLDNAANDGRDMSEALRALGFVVVAVPTISSPSRASPAAGFLALRFDLLAGMISILTYSLPDSVRDCKNLAGGTWVAPRGRAIALTSPHDGRPIGTLRLSTSADVDDAAIAAHRASIAWGATPMRERAVPLRRFLSLASRHASSLAGTVALESGKTPDEALAGIQRGLEVVEFALSLPNQDTRRRPSFRVLRGVT